LAFLLCRRLTWRTLWAASVGARCLFGPTGKRFFLILRKNDLEADLLGDLLAGRRRRAGACSRVCCNLFARHRRFPDKLCWRLIARADAPSPELALRTFFALSFRCARVSHGYFYSGAGHSGYRTLVLYAAFCTGNNSNVRLRTGYQICGIRDGCRIQFCLSDASFRDSNSGGYGRRGDYLPMMNSRLPELDDYRRWHYRGCRRLEALWWRAGAWRFLQADGTCVAADERLFRVFIADVCEPTVSFCLHILFPFLLRTILRPLDVKNNVELYHVTARLLPTRVLCLWNWNAWTPACAGWDYSAGLLCSLCSTAFPAFDIRHIPCAAAAPDGRLLLRDGRCCTLGFWFDFTVYAYAPSLS